MTPVNRIARVALVLAGLSAACAPHSHVDDHWGEAYRSQKEQQIANPAAGDEVKPVEGMASTTARDVSTTYHTRQLEQPQPNQERSLFDLIEVGD
jgi:hypothetical protein